MLVQSLERVQPYDLLVYHLPVGGMAQIPPNQCLSERGIRHQTKEKDIFGRDTSWNADSIPGNTLGVCAKCADTYRSLLDDQPIQSMNASQKSIFSPRDNPENRVTDDDRAFLQKLRSMTTVRDHCSVPIPGSVGAGG